MQPEQAVFLRDFLVQGLEQEAKTTRRVLETVPATGNAYRPDAKSRTGFELAWHIAASGAWFAGGIVAGSFDPSTDKSATVPPEIKTPADIVAHYDRNYIPKLEQLKALNGAQLSQTVDFFGVYNFPLVVYLAWLNNHEIHHRGQLCAYLRAMGGKVPSIYGGSADEPFEMSAKA